jgi:hypothetical protein
VLYDGGLDRTERVEDWAAHGDTSKIRLRFLCFEVSVER